MLRTLFPGHARWAKDVDAFVDAELLGSALSRFDSHRASCARCQASVEDTRTLKSAVSAAQAPTPTRSFRITAAMVAPPERIPRAVTRPATLVLRGALATTVLTAGAFGVSLFVTAAQDDGPRNANSLPAERTTTYSSGQLSSDLSTGAATALATEAAPKFVSTVTPIAIGTPSVAAVSGASSGSGTGELGRPGGSPQPPATGAQPMAESALSDQAARSADVSKQTPAEVPSLPGALVAEDGYRQGLPVTGGARDTRSNDDDGLRRVQFGLAIATASAMAVAIAAAIWRQRRSYP